MRKTDVYFFKTYKAIYNIYKSYIFFMLNFLIETVDNSAFILYNRYCLQ